ncbi:protein involved in ribonucleotide reduction [Mycoplasma testudineum]|uniref:Protein NrdI n=1 Tax=Mycoplasma testudineum TaxID=244584 RepID=A0A4R6IBY5_9MOLU|nr:class Ib ribonucleoside-diphosphate reductase assembly flavoprotein NrdI [Mycoplasma testudineum]OYD26609.1 class Ib ribonucleoside-diphosphate reductase assembly flavoprotein NrdI [Mycoplasma testudineum]TDO19442.1 protein involved in ribonucleotide reduction [Mycoplasma testudineum]
MHKDIIEMSDVLRPTGEPEIVYFSSKSNNTHRFIQKLEIENKRIPVDESMAEPVIDKDFVLICPTYSGGDDSTKGAVPSQVIKFLNDEQRRKYCRGVVATGNTNFGSSFALAGPILSKRLKVPLLYQLELLGTQEDVTNLRQILFSFWNKSE